MPELPEAETIVRGIRTAVIGTRILRTRVLHADVLDERPARFVRSVKGRVITDVRRRGKNVVLDLDSGAALVVNLGMTGGLFPLRPRQRNPSVTHPAIRFQLAPGGQLVYNDARRFGRVRVLDAAAWDTWSGGLGPEPLSPEFTRGGLTRDLQRSRSPIRNWLLDQRRVAGVGNIYASEALFRAGVDPRRAARSLTGPEAHALHRAIVTVLEEAIEARGTTIRDFRDAAGEGGSFGPRLRVYGREGKPCYGCGTPIRRVVFGNRSAFLCPACQVGPEILEGRPT